MPAYKYALLDAYIWALLTPLVFWSARVLVSRFRSWWSRALLIVLLGMLFALAHSFAFIYGLPWIGYRTGPQVVQNVLRLGFHSRLLACWVLFGIWHGIDYYRRYQMRELKASQLEGQLARAQLESLRTQLQPHFLFNTMHAISALMYRDIDAADRMITRLADFLRLTLESSGVQEVPLKRELEYLSKYVEIEQVRFGERLEVRESIEPAAFDLMVPNLILQPLVENAVRHGIAPRASGGRVEVTATVSDGRLTIDVQDDGLGPKQQIVEGVGLSNTRARLRQLYGDCGTLELGAATKSGFRARLTLPAKVAGGV